MKHSKNVDELIIAAFMGEAGEEDLMNLKKWRAASEENERQFRYLEKIWKERSAEPDFLNADELAEKIWKEGVGEIPGKRNIRNSRKIGRVNFNYLLKIAAVLVIFAVTPYILYLLRGKINEEAPTPAVNSIITKTNPAGQKTRISLPDGSVVWLNSSSSLSYPAFFSDSSRMIELSGEAYFDVKTDSLRPFTVKSGNIYTTALGTDFNISAYPEENKIQIGLITGRVRISDERSSKSIILTPNTGVIYHKNNEEMQEIQIDPADVLAWKNGILKFDGEDFQTFVSRLEQWYGVKILVEGEPPHNWRIRGRFADEYLTNILNSISFNKEFSYTINRKEVVLKFD